MENSRINDDDVTRHAVQFNAHGLMEDALMDVLETWYSIVYKDSYNTFPGDNFSLTRVIRAASRTPCFRCFRRGATQNGLYSHRRWLKA